MLFRVVSFLASRRVTDFHRQHDVAGKSAEPALVAERLWVER